MFNFLRIKKQIKKVKSEPPTFAIGVDTYGSVFSYCLVRKIGANREIILAKKSRDKEAFRLEVERMAEYFNAIIYEEK